MVPERGRKRFNVLFFYTLFVMSGMCAGCAAVCQPVVKPASDTGEHMYQEALTYISDREESPAQYTAAIQKLMQFSTQYPDHSRCAEALLWVSVLEKLQALKNIELENIKK